MTDTGARGERARQRLAAANARVIAAENELERARRDQDNAERAIVSAELADGEIPNRRTA